MYISFREICFLLKYACIHLDTFDDECNYLDTLSYVL